MKSWRVADFQKNYAKNNGTVVNLRPMKLVPYSVYCGNGRTPTMIAKKLILIGGGEFAREILWAASATGSGERFGWTTRRVYR